MRKYTELYKKYKDLREEVDRLKLDVEILKIEKRIREIGDKVIIHRWLNIDMWSFRAEYVNCNELHNVEFFSVQNLYATYTSNLILDTDTFFVVKIVERFRSGNQMVGFRRIDKYTEKIRTLDCDELEYLCKKSGVELEDKEQDNENRF